MIHEFRVYTALPGKLAALEARFADHTVAIWARHGIRALGFWTTILGRSNNQLTYILEWTSLAEREEKWAAFQSDPVWRKVRDESERNGAIVANIESELLTPTAFSRIN
jgi:hypothetical protein